MNRTGVPRASLGILGEKNHEVTKLEREGHRREAASAEHLGGRGGQLLRYDRAGGGILYARSLPEKNNQTGHWGDNTTGVLLLF